MNKSGTPKKNKKRPSIKVTAQNSKYIPQWIGKDQSIADWVNKAIEFKHLDNVMQRKAEAYDRMKESGTFQHNEKLKQDVDELKRNTNKLENRINVLVKENAFTLKYFIKLKDEFEEVATLGKKRMKETKKLLKK